MGEAPEHSQTMSFRMAGWVVGAALVWCNCGGEQREVTAPEEPADRDGAGEGASTSAPSAEPGDGQPGGAAGEGSGDAGLAAAPDQVRVPLLTADLIRETVRPQYEDMATCYRDGLKRDPQLAGTVDVALTIDGDGSVIEARQKDGPAGKGGKPSRHRDDPISDAAVVSCVLTKFKAIRFPASQRGMMSTVYPIVFATQ